LSGFAQERLTAIGLDGVRILDRVGLEAIAID